MSPHWRAPHATVISSTLLSFLALGGSIKNTLWEPLKLVSRFVSLNTERLAPLDTFIAIAVIKPASQCAHGILSHSFAACSGFRNTRGFEIAAPGAVKFIYESSSQPSTRVVLLNWSS